MMRKPILFIGILFACSILSAKTPLELKAEMDDVLPAGMKVRMAWVNTNGSAYVYESEENVLRDLTPTSEFGSGRNISKAYVSQDGEYVVLKDQGSDEIMAVKFDGTGKQTLADQGTLICTWKDPDDNKQCFIASALPGKTGTWAIGITDQSKERQVAEQTFPKTSSQWGFGCGISVDGLRMGGYDNNKPGLWPIPSGSFIPAGSSPVEPAGDCTGCNFAIRPTTGGVYEYGHFHESHRTICVHNEDGSFKEALNMGCPVSGNEAHGLMWSNHLDYVTARLAEDAPNPVLFDVVREKCVALKDDCNGDCGDDGLNAILLSKSDVESRVSVMIPHAPRAPQKLYSMDGRLLSKSQTRALKFAVRPIWVSAQSQAAGIIVGCR